jgi:hypothetical protein
MKIDRPENFAAATAMARPPQSGFTFPSIGGRQKEEGRKSLPFCCPLFQSVIELSTACAMTARNLHQAQWGYR